MMNGITIINFNVYTFYYTVLMGKQIKKNTLIIIDF